MILFKINYYFADGGADDAVFNRRAYMKIKIMMLSRYHSSRLLLH